MTLAFKVGHELYQAVDLPEDVPSYAVLGGVRTDGTVMPPRPRATRASLMRLGVARVKAEHRASAEEAEAAIIAKQLALAQRRESRNRSPQSQRSGPLHHPYSSSSRSRSRSIDEAATAVPPYQHYRGESTTQRSVSPQSQGRPAVPTVPPLRSFSAPITPPPPSRPGAAENALPYVVVASQHYSDSATSSIGGAPTASPVAGAWCECCGLPVRAAAAVKLETPKRVAFQAASSPFDKTSAQQGRRALHTVSPRRVEVHAVEGGGWPTHVTVEAVPASQSDVAADQSDDADSSKKRLEEQLRALWSPCSIWAFAMGGLVATLMRTPPTPTTES